MGDFQEQVVLITGAGLGIGRAAAQAFAQQGACVAGVDITPVNLDITLANIRSAGGKAQDYICDVGKLMPVQIMIDQVLADWGRIDCLVNCTSVRPRAALLAMDEWDFRRTLEVNLTGAFFLIQQVGRIMRQAGGGTMVHLIAPLQQVQGWPELGGFAASQAGLAGLVQAAGRELEPYGIQVNGVCPSGIEDAALVQRAVERIIQLCRYDGQTITGQVVAVE
jgi:3-oxoacyl-[acyl-carrier protein] reductase